MFNNRLIIQFGKETYPQVNKDSTNSAWVGFPIAYKTVYKMFIDYITDAGATHHLRHTNTTTQATGATVHWYSTGFTTMGSGLFCWLCIGY